MRDELIEYRIPALPGHVSLDNDNAALATVRRATVQGVKLHILGLEHIKAKLGQKWSRLSALVHKLMKKAIVRTQGPFDHFVVLDELSYAVTFAKLSPAQTDLVCEAIAREVCELLFGEQVQEISIRTVTAPVSEMLMSSTECEEVLERTIEEGGTESVYRYARPVAAEPQVSARPLSPVEFLQQKTEALAAKDFQIRLYPVWELRKGASNSLLLRIEGGRGDGGEPYPSHAQPEQLLEHEIVLLQVAEAYAGRLTDDHQICAINTAVSFDTMSCLHTRIAYLTALQKTSFSPQTPLVVRIIDIPQGAPDGRLAELIAMLHSCRIKVALKFAGKISRPGLRLGADGIGMRLPDGMNPEEFLPIAKSIADLALQQKAFPFLDGLDSAAAVGIARQSTIRFGTGTALGKKMLQATGTLSRFPLAL